MKYSICQRNLLLAILLSVAAPSLFAEETALDRYIAKPDAAYKWSLDSSIEGEGYKAYVLALTSQTWRSEKEVDRPVWTHWLTVIVPDKLEHDRALLYIGGGENGDAAPKKVGERTAMLALETNTPVAELGQVPNQPLFFADSNKHGRDEDDLIAYSRVKFIVTGDEDWLVRLAMVKSAVRAMDAVQEFMASDAGGKHPIKGFVVVGGSKRGWTTWLAGIEDPRVVAIMPLVIDALNSQEITRHHYNAYGFFSSALGDYVRHGLFPHALGTPEYGAVMKIEDPYEYRDREKMKTMPKYAINASGDQFFLPDNANLYWDDLPGTKHIRYVPNVKHNLEGGDARESMVAYYSAILNGAPLPRFEWTRETNGAIRVTVKDHPMEVNLWQASNPNARDFRLDVIGKAWKSTPLKEQDGVYIGEVDKPTSGYTAYYVELVYESGTKYPFKFTTTVSVAPDVLPFDLDKATEIEMH